MKASESKISKRLGSIRVLCCFVRLANEVPKNTLLNLE